MTVKEGHEVGFALHDRQRGSGSWICTIIIEEGQEVGFALAYLETIEGG